MSNHLVKKNIVDKNGKSTTVNVLPEQSISPHKKRKLPSQPVVDPHKDIIAARQVLTDKLSSLFPHHSLDHETFTVRGDNYKNLPDFTAIDINILVQDSSDSEPFGISITARGTDYKWIHHGYTTIVSEYYGQENIDRMHSMLVTTLPAIKNYHDAMFLELNGTEPEPETVLNNAEEARAFLLDFAGYEPWHDQNNARLLGMSHKIARTERYSHKLPDIFRAVELLEASGEKVIPEHLEVNYAHNREMYEIIKKSRTTI